jgi:uncharacterized delta-60 repeat protein
MLKALAILFGITFSCIAQEQTNLVHFLSTEALVNEAVPSLPVVVARDGDTNATVSVDFILTAGEGAVPDADFTTASGTLTFNPGETNQTISVSILDDELPEPQKFITLYLTNLVGDSLLTNSLLSIRLIDNDGKPNSLDPNPNFSNLPASVINDLVITPDGLLWFACEGAQNFGLLNPDGSSAGQPPPSLGPSATLSLAQDPQEAVIRIGQNVADFGGSVARAWGVYDDHRFDLNGVSLLGRGNKVLLRKDTSLIASGTFYLKGQTNTFGLVSVDRSGGINPDFQDSTAGLSMLTAALDTNDNVYASFVLTNENSSVTYGLGKWNSDGTRDTNFASAILVSTDGVSRVSLLVSEPDASAFLAAVTTEQAESEETRIVRLLYSGEIDTNFSNLLPPIHGLVHSIAFGRELQSSIQTNSYDLLYLGGEFSGAGDILSSNLLSLRRTGELNWALEPGEGPDAPVNIVLPEKDGTLLVGGAFTEFSGYPAHGLVRLRGNQALAKSYVWFDRDEFRGYEKSGQVQLSISRAGTSTNAPLVLSLNAAALEGSVSGLGALPVSIEFAPGETNKIFDVPLINDSLPGEKIYELAIDSANDVLITRPSVRARVLDDETPGTADAFFASGLDVYPRVMALQPDGKIIVGYWSGRPRVARLNPDGSLDPNFISDGFPVDRSTASYNINKIRVLPSGKIYIAGTFLESSTVPANNYIVRLNPDGSLDTSFYSGLRPNTGFNPSFTFELEPDGTPLVNASFDLVGPDSFAHGYTARFNSDGTFNKTFSISDGSPMGNPLSAIALQADGRLLGFTSHFPRELHRYDLTGRIESGFKVTSKGNINTIVPTADSIFIAGDFTEINGVPVSSIAKLRMNDGSLDTNFLAAPDGIVSDILPLASGKLLVSGAFTRMNGVDAYRIVRLNNDGSVDPAFQTGLGLNEVPYELAEQPDHKILVAGGFAKMDLVPFKGLVRLEDTASPGLIRLVSRQIVVRENDPFVTIELERVDGSQGTLPATISTFDQSALAGVDYVSTNVTFTFADGETGRRTIEIPITYNPAITGNKTFGLHFDTGVAQEDATVVMTDLEAGSFDPQFHPVVAGGLIRDIAGLPDGKYMIVGAFQRIDSQFSPYIARLNADSTFDTTLAARPDTPADSLAVQPDGNILVGGTFFTIGSTNVNPLIRLFSDLSIDRSFDSNRLSTLLTSPQGLALVPPSDVYTWSSYETRRLTNGVLDRSFPSRSLVNALAITSDGNLLFADSRGLTRTFPSGKSDTNFNVLVQNITSGHPSSAPVQSLALESDDSILIGGRFNLVNGTNVLRLARLSPDGVLDTSFQARIGTNSTSGAEQINTIQPLPNGQILVGGTFLTVNGISRPYLARLNHDGSLDEDFNPLLSGSGVTKIKPMPDGSMIVLGGFDNVNGVDVSQVFKLSAMTNLSPYLIITSPTNGQTVIASDTLPMLSADITAWDPDGFLRQVRVALDGEFISTNQVGPFHIPISTAAPGAHTLTVYAEDMLGSLSTNTVDFTILQAISDAPLAVQLIDNSVKIQWTGHMQLESSDDLQTWSPVELPLDATEYTVPDQPSSPHRYFRGHATVTSAVSP